MKILSLSSSSGDWIPSGLAVRVSYGPEYFKSFALCCRGVVGGSVMKQKCTESQRYGLPGRGLTPVSHILIWQFSLPSPTWACCCCMIYDFREMCTRNEHWKLQRTRLSRKNIQTHPSGYLLCWSVHSCLVKPPLLKSLGFRGVFWLYTVGYE